MQKSLVALDTNHLKGSFLKTDVLKEIRGAGLILDRLSRVAMVEVARESSASLIYASGGSGLFLIDEDKADLFGKRVQKAFLESSRGNFSITYAVQQLPAESSEDAEKLMTYDLSRELELVRYKLREKKDIAETTVVLPSHPFFRPCESCGLEYAEEKASERGVLYFYCVSCKEKHDEDERVEEGIVRTIEMLREERMRHPTPSPNSYQSIPDDEVQSLLWDRLLFSLQKTQYAGLFDGRQQMPGRPSDFALFRRFPRSKEHLGLIYADVNNTGASIETFTTLAEIKQFSTAIDQALHAALCSTIEKELPLSLMVDNQENEVTLFPFDVLSLKDDEVVMVVDASRAMDVALALAQEFRRCMKSERSLSVGVVLAPSTYPFSLLVNLVESTLNFAKKSSAQARAASSVADDTYINFMIVTSGSLSSFDAMYDKMYHKIEGETEFYATLRPYTPDKLQHLLNTIREGNRLNLGRSKLHQLREAIVKMNLTQSVFDGLAILRNWQEMQRNLIVNHVYQFGGLYQVPQSNAHDPIKGFPRVTFPWFTDASEKKRKKERTVYRTPLLDFVELYDFVRMEGEEAGVTN